MMVRGLGTVIYHVAGLNRAKTWYTQAFQQQPYFDEPFYIGFNIGGQISIMLYKNLATHRISSLSKRPDNLHLWRLL